MTWLSRLYETYDHALKLKGDAEKPLMPVGHTSQQVNIAISIDALGNFSNAEILGKVQLILPATEESAGRTSGRVAHPLIDQIRYCAKDYSKYSNNESFFDLYEKTLAGWVNSSYAHPMAKAVYNYVMKGTLVADLVEKKILHLAPDGKLATVAAEGEDIPVFKLLTAKKEKINNVTQAVRDQGMLMIAWQVNIAGENESRSWLSQSLQQSWIAYNASMMENKGLCMLTGEEGSTLASQHPRNLRKPGDKAKLISSNDNKGFTFRGRFIEASEACSVGYEASHMAHNALRWLIERQGYITGSHVVLAWTPSGKKMASPADDMLEDDNDDIDFSNSAEQDSGDIPTVNDTGINHTRDLGQTFALQLKKRLKGYDNKLDDTDTVAVLTLDSATPGRVSVVGYMEQPWPQYRAALESWQSDFAWLIYRSRELHATKGKKAKNVRYWKLTAPTPREIAFTAYGRRLDDVLTKNTINRILPCIVDGRPIPYDLVASCIRRAIARSGMENWEWNEVLGVACAMYRGYWARHTNKRSYTMGLDLESTSRDYLFGRMLAVAERIERVALSIANENRPTSAERLMTRFADYPMKTWQQIELNIRPYRLRLMSSRSNFIRKMDRLLDEIHSLFQEDDYSRSGKLSGEFLLGYHCQREAMRKEKDKDTTEENNEGENK